MCRSDSQWRSNIVFRSSEMLKVEEILPFSSLQCLKMKRSHACSHVLSLPVTVNSLLLLGKPCLHQLTVESETWDLSVNKDEDTDISTNERPDVMLAGFGSLENTPNTKSLFFFFLSWTLLSFCHSRDNWPDYTSAVVLHQAAARSTTEESGRISVHGNKKNRGCVEEKSCSLREEKEILELQELIRVSCMLEWDKRRETPQSLNIRRDFHCLPL